MEYDLEKIKEALKNQLISMLLGYGQGRNSYTTVPMIFKKQEDLNKLTIDYFCNHNLVTYVLELTKKPGTKLAIMVKPCDEKSLIELQRENQIEKNRVIVVSLPCKGVVDLKKIAALKNKNTESIDKIEIEADKVTIKFAKRTIAVDLIDVISHKCIECEHFPHLRGHNELESLDSAVKQRNDVMGQSFPSSRDSIAGSIGHNELESLDSAVKPRNDDDVLDSSRLREYWLQEYESCIRCGACRKVCPMCYCETCIFEQPKSGLLDQQASRKDNGTFLIGRAMHMAGRCTGCGRCSEVCPVSINHKGINKPLAQYVLDTFDFKAGEKNDIPPLFSSANMNETEDFPEHE